MLWRILLTLSLALMMCGMAEADAPPQTRTPEPGPGVPRELARHRAAHYRDVRYALDVLISPGAEMLKGSVKITVTLDAAAGDLVLDWRMSKKEEDAASRVSNIKANGRPVNDARVADEHILIPRSHLKTGANTFEMDFSSPISTSGSALTRYLDREDKSEYVYTLFVPSDASTAFPCFDQPDLKARFKLTLSAPEGWKAVSNTLPEETSKGVHHREGKIYTHTTFKETEPISTYVFAFAAGPFEDFKDDASRHGTRLFVRKSKAEAARKELKEVFRLNREGIKFFEDYFARPFPFPKYDLVIIPEFPFRGMEHAGATFLREETIIFPSDPTANDLWSRADVMLHEAAHQWFGDLVTMKWFDDLWLKEGFATFMSSKAIDALMPEFDAWKVFYLRTKPLAYETDVTKGTTPIFQEIANLSAAKSAYGNIVYRKAPSMLRQAEFYLGAREFQEAVRLLLREHAYANAEWADLVRAFERTSKRRLTAWADAWVKRRGMPAVRARWTKGARGRIRRLTLEQADVLGEGGAWPMRVRVLLAGRGGAGPEVLNVTLRGGSTEVREAAGRPAPAFVFANHEDYGYGLFLLDDESRAEVLRSIGTIRDDFLRALLWGTLWDSVREAELPPADFIELAVRHAARERDDVTLQFILARVQTAFTRYLSVEQTNRLAPPLEAMLREGMLKAETPGLRITYFRTFRDVARTAGARQELIKILSGETKVPGMTLRARDRFDIVRALMSGGDGRAPKLLDELSDEEKSDDARRYAYAAGAAWPDGAVKRRYFEQYLRDRDLSESWIEASFVPFNAPRQAGLTLPHLEPALRELPALKRTRKIFFVNGWLAAFIGGQCGGDALQTVRDFLAREQSLDRDLRLKVLEATDGLERCVRIRARYAPEGRDDSARPAP